MAKRIPLCQISRKLDKAIRELGCSNTAMIIPDNELTDDSDAFLYSKEIFPPSALVVGDYRTQQLKVAISVAPIAMSMEDMAKSAKQKWSNYHNQLKLIGAFKAMADYVEKNNEHTN